MTNKWIAIFGILWAATFVAGCTAESEEEKLRAVLKSRLPSAPITSITKSKMGLYEVVLNGEIIYTDKSAEYFLGGNLYDVRTDPPRNLTQETQGRAAAKSLVSMRDSAIKTVRGNGKRVVYTFEDPNCGYCRQLHPELLKLNDVTVYTFLTPILSPDSVEKSRAVWCAADRAKAWEQLMTTGVVPDGPKTCDTPIEKTLQAMKQLGFRGTPAIYLANGQNVGGFVPAARIESALASVN